MAFIIIIIIIAILLNNSKKEQRTENSTYNFTKLMKRWRRPLSAGPRTRTCVEEHTHSKREREKKKKREEKKKRGQDLLVPVLLCVEQ